MPLKLSESTNILFIRIIYSIRIPYILWNDGLLSTLILFLEIFRSHAELFQKQFGMTPKEFEKQQRMTNTNDYNINLTK